MVSDRMLDDSPADRRRRRSARWLVVVGFAVWSAGLALWEQTWIGSLAASVAGGAAVTYGSGRLAHGSADARSPEWGVVVPVTISLILISQGVGRAEFAGRVALVGLGTLGIMLVFLRILDERLTIERQLAERILVDERRRLAADVHDVVGHTLSASMLHTTAARLSIRSDPDAAIASLERAEQQGRRSMDDIGSVVNLLRDAAGNGPPMRLAGDLPDLVEGLRSAGAEIRYTASGRLDDLSAPTALTVYRVVQEGLTNAARHGTGVVDVTIDVGSGPDHVEIEIANARRVPHSAVAPGSGLAGMRERVNAIGGTLDAGATKSGDRWVVRARILT